MGSRGGNQSVVSLYICVSGRLSQIWSEAVPGKIESVSFADVSGDSAPEICVQTRVFDQPENRSSPLGCSCLLVYENRSVTYELAYNATFRSNTWDLVRVHAIDYYGNGTRCLLVSLDQTLHLFRCVQGVYSHVAELPYTLLNDFAVGDVNNDGRADIVTTRWGLNVLENQGTGFFLERPKRGDMGPIDEVEVGDVNRDGQNEIVMVGINSINRPNAVCLSVWKYVDRDYRELWTYRGPSEPATAIQSMDIGDVNGDGIDEIVTSAELTFGESTNSTRGMSIWKSRGTGRPFFRLWEGKDTLSVNFMQVLRVCSMDDSGGEKVVGLDTDGKLYLIGRKGGTYRTRSIAVKKASCLDVWPIV